MHIKRLLDPDIIQDEYGSDVRIWTQDDLEWTWHAHWAFRAQRWIKLKLDPVGRSRERCITWTRYHTNAMSKSTSASYNIWNNEKEDLNFKARKWILKLDPFDCSAHMWCWKSMGMLIITAYQRLVIIHVCSCAKKFTYMLTLNL